MPLAFEIRPLNIDTGYSLSCPGVMAENLYRQKLISAVAEAAVLGGGLAGEIRIYDCAGHAVEVVPLPTLARSGAASSL